MKAFCIILLLILGGQLTAQNVGINTITPAYNLDVKGTDDTTQGGELRISTLNSTNYLHLFSGRLGDRNPFLSFHESDTFHIVSSLPDFSSYQRRMTITPDGKIGVGTDRPEGVLHLRGHSSIPFPQLRLTDTVDNFARIKMETTVGDSSFWDIAASTTPGITAMNFFFQNDTLGNNVFQILPELGQLRHRSLTPSVRTFYFANNNDYQGAIGFQNEDLIVRAVRPEANILFGTRNIDRVIIDTVGRVGIGTLSPIAELDVNTDDVDDGAALHLSNADKSHFLRLFSGRQFLPYPIMYWNHGSHLEFGKANADDSNYQTFVTMDGRSIGIQNTGRSIFIGAGAGENDDLVDNGNIGIGQGALYSNSAKENIIAIGDSSLYNNGLGATTNEHARLNLAIGSRALYSNTTGGLNMAIGYRAMEENISGTGNFAIGSYALNNLTDSDNTAIGLNSQRFRQTGKSNTSIGSHSLINQENGFANSVLGHWAMLSTTNGDQNTAIGAYTLENSTSSFYNTTLGYGTIRNSESSSLNTAIGYLSLGCSEAGHSNTGVGTWTLFKDSTGYQNTALGLSSSYSNRDGNENTSIGYKALEGNQDGSFNVAVGAKSGPGDIASPASISGGVYIGYEAGKNSNANNRLYIENSDSTTPLIYGEFDNNLLRVNGEQEITGELDITKTGVALRVNGQEALWSNGTYFSYGFGIDHNYFAKPMRIGPVEGSNTPFADLHVVDNSGNANLAIESHSGDAVLQLAGNTNSATDGWTISRKASDNDMEWRYNSIKKLELTDFGNLGLGVSNPTHTFEMAGTFDHTASVNGFNNYVATFRNTANDNTFVNEGIEIVAGHTVYNGPTNNMIQFSAPNGTSLGRIAQNSSSSVAYFTNSDKRLKMDIKPSEFGLDEILKVKVCDYYWKKDLKKSRKQTGFIAQELHEVIPNAANEGGEDENRNPWTIDSSQLIPLLTKAIQEQQVMMEKMQKEIDELKVKCGSK